MARRRKNTPFLFRFLDFTVAVLRPFARAQRNRDMREKQAAKDYLTSIKAQEIEANIELKQAKLQAMELELAIKRATLDKREADAALQWNKVTLQDATVEELREAMKRKKKDQAYMDQFSD